MNAAMQEIVSKARETAVKRAREIDANRVGRALRGSEDWHLAGRLHNDMYRFVTDRTPGRWALREIDEDDLYGSDQEFDEKREAFDKRKKAVEKLGLLRLVPGYRYPKGLLIKDDESKFRYQYVHEKGANLRVYVTLKEHNRGRIGRLFVDLIESLERKGIPLVEAKAIQPTTPQRRESMVLYLNIPGVREELERNRVLQKTLNHVRDFCEKQGNRLFPQEERELPHARVHDRELGVTWALQPTRTETDFYEEVTGIRNKDRRLSSYNMVLSAMITPAVLRELARTQPQHADALNKEAERIERIVDRYKDKLMI